MRIPVERKGRAHSHTSPIISFQKPERTHSNETSIAPPPWPLALERNSSTQAPSHDHQLRSQPFQFLPSILDRRDHLKLAASLLPSADIPKGHTSAPDIPKLQAQHHNAAANASRPSHLPAVASSAAATPTLASPDELGRGGHSAPPRR